MEKSSSNINNMLEINLKCYVPVKLFVDNRQTYVLDQEHNSVRLHLPCGSHVIRLEEEHRLLRDRWWLYSFIPFRFFGHAFFKDAIGELPLDSSIAVTEFYLKTTNESNVRLFFGLQTFDKNSNKKRHFFDCEAAHGISKEVIFNNILPRVFVLRWLYEKVMPLIVWLGVFYGLFFGGRAPIWLPISYSLCVALRMLFLIKKVKNIPTEEYRKRNSFRRIKKKEK